MKLDLIEIKPKNYKRKVFIAIVISILFIIAFSFLGIKVAEAYNKKIIAKRNEISVSKKNHENNKQEENKQEENKQTRQDNIENINSSEEAIENMNSNKLPVYSENAKKKLKSLYTDDTKVAYLTFDDGPSQTVTPQILDLLKQEDIKATFFVLGSRVKANPDLVKREYQEGHFIANHGYSHEYSQIYKSVDSVIDEYNKTETQIQKAIGIENYHSHLFRFPGGLAGGKYASIKSQANELLEQNNIAHVDWNALNGDAETNNLSPEFEISRIHETIEGKNSIVVLMHDSPAKSVTADTLPQIIATVRDKGYEFKNFYEIIK